MSNSYRCNRSPALYDFPRPLRSSVRSAVLAALRVLIPREVGERGRLALLGGEAGSGKSRLVRESANEVAGEGVLVLYGACDAVVQTAYRPFAEALDQLVRGTDPDVCSERTLGLAPACSPACFPTWTLASVGCRRR